VVTVAEGGGLFVVERSSGRFLWARPFPYDDPNINMNHIDVKTGQIKWHYQNTPNDSWDFDGVNEFITFDMDGKRVGGKADRNGYFYVNDATTGKLINAFPFVRKTTWANGIDLKTGRPNFVPENRPGDPTAGADGVTFVLVEERGAEAVAGLAAAVL